MTKKEIDLIRQFGMAISEHASDEVQQQVLKGSENLKKSSRAEMSTWLQSAMQRFDALVEEGTRNRIMQDCGYNCARVNKSTIERMGRKREKFSTLEEFIDNEAKHPSKIQRIERDGDRILQYYSPKEFRDGWRCFCGVWRELPGGEKTSSTWCQCSRAFVEKVWEMYAGRPVQVELLQSSISGAKECIFEIKL